MKPLTPLKITFPIILAACLFFCMYGCKKAGKTTVPSSPSELDFTYSGTLWVYDTITFHSTAPAGSAFFWKFGDGTTSTDSAPLHVYTAINYTNIIVTLNDTVTLIVNNDTLHQVSKVLKIAPGAERLAGTWRWTGGRFVPNGSVPPSDTAHNLNDISFSITLVNDSTIQVWGETLPFCPVLNSYCNLSEYTGHSGSQIVYTPDTIYFTNSWGGNGRWDIIYYHFP